MGTHTIELTLDELKIIARALAYEVDRLDEIGSSRLEDTESLENRVHDMYINARRSIEHERSWINAEKDRV